jgi:hypothetical protein
MGSTILPVPFREQADGEAPTDLIPDNGKAERFVQTSLREWAYARAYGASAERAAELPIWLHRYNWHRPHGSTGSKPPISRLSLPRDNALKLLKLAIVREPLHRFCRRVLTAGVLQRCCCEWRAAGVTETVDVLRVHIPSL